ncbi:MAG TPA: hypothetical protein VKX31_07465 [Brumimicrobium sp.]|nr:hypothetical protein [Brumimicrobium sp.]
MFKERKIPKWKEKEELFKKGSFDEALESLGAGERFVDKDKTKKEESKKVPCEEV